MSDHFAHFDKSITMYNFLKFSNKQWKWIDNNLMPQNRLRINDYKKMYAQLEINIIEETFSPGNISQLNTLRLNTDYLTMQRNELAITHCQFISLFKLSL